MTEFENLLSAKAEEAMKLIEAFVPSEEGPQKRVIEAMNYSFLAGGKRLRPIFMLESYRLFKGEDLSSVAPFMAAIEMIHTYSLIHDDLPAMDNDDYRRGRLTNHKKFDEATAILAGDGLLNLAFETASEAMKNTEDAEVLKRMAKALSVLSKKSGYLGMIGGQEVDLMNEDNPDTSLEDIMFIHKCKTSALIEASLTVGAIIAGASDEEVSKIEEVGTNVGLAFQIQDDILDVIGDSSVIGKPVGSDADNDKITYVSLMGLEKAEADQKMYSEKAVKILEELPYKNDFLNQLIDYLVSRRK